MHRALFTPLTRSVAARVAVRSTMAARPVVFAPRMVRFSSNDAKAPEGEAKPEATEGETTKEESTEQKEVDPAEEFKAQLAKKDKDLADMKNHYARAIADFRNLQESTKKEVQKAKDFALQKFAKDLLESIDNFSLALSAVKEETLATNDEVKNLYEGVSMTQNVFEKTLNRHGIQKIDPMGEPFDPNQHEATFEIPQPDKEPGTVFHVQQPGYTLNSRVLRPAKVGIVKDVEN
ncbi:GrpE-domain-containing protein [Suhomyces tanzawaensis NRRL Y-17324]|uniref:GrpE protein homolog n=1 Tax=Suhomyces tanzawaensis NRRL Y-17324 TaxID=984487 RepID=A0A1E4SK57_9ASCO|nr:GrpE-domain-containing protein [Suhomyces tanzawaensis NRRL Y-17324]ODV79878.1 GrpE-domain-containing protein [Suhomyces tanzawaensis NRRL Y-17324]